MFFSYSIHLKARSLLFYFVQKEKKSGVFFVCDVLLKFVVNCSHCSASQSPRIPPTPSFLHLVSAEGMVYTSIIIF